MKDLKGLAPRRVAENTDPDRPKNPDSVRGEKFLNWLPLDERAKKWLAVTGGREGEWGGAMVQNRPAAWRLHGLDFCLSLCPSRMLSTKVVMWLMLLCLPAAWLASANRCQGPTLVPGIPGLPGPPGSSGQDGADGLKGERGKGVPACH